MARSSIFLAAPLGLLLILPSAPAETAASAPELGPPWISVEMPANPIDRETRGAAFVVRVYHHETPASYVVTGRAEGLVNGRRESLDLELSETSRPGVYAVRQQWPAEGHWVLALSVGAHAEASVVLELGPGGGVTDDDYYGQPAKALAMRSIRTMSGAPSERGIDSALQAMVTAALE